MKKILTLLLFFSVFLQLSAETATDGTFQYEIDTTNRTATVVGKDPTLSTLSGSVTIPDSIGGYPVTAIGNYAFPDCTALTEITIPNSVTAIGEGTFSRCSSLTSISMPSSVTSIGDGAFYKCTALTAITIPSSVTAISTGTFNGCSSLTEISIPSSVTTIGDAAFKNCTALTEISIPNSVTAIGDGAFLGCSALTEITIPSSVTAISTFAFYGCSALTSITIPNSVTTIGDAAFRDCSKLTKIAIPSSVTTIGEGAFNGCSALTEITIPSSVTAISIGTFLCCSALTTISIPGSVTAIGDAAFAGCYALTKITIPDSVTVIGKQAFYGCSSLTKLVFMPKTPPTITSDVFTAEYFTAPNCIFYAPGGCIDAYKNAQNYSYIADYPWSSLIDPDKVTLKPGESIQLAPTFSPDSVTWTSSDETVATVDSLGNVTAKGVGNATITANFGTGSDDCAVTVVPTLAESITLSQSVWAGKVGEALQLTATVAPENATDKTVTWTSSNETVATVDATGNVTIVAEGNATITATSNDGSGIKAECVITGTSGIDSALADMDSFDIYSADGRALVKNATRNDLKKLGNGIYILKTTAKTTKIVIR